MFTFKIINQRTHVQKYLTCVPCVVPILQYDSLFLFN